MLKTYDLFFATKADLQLLKADLGKQIQGVRAELKTEIQAVKSYIIKWMFVVQFGAWITIMSTILIIYFLK